MDDSLLVVDESVVGSVLGHLTFEVPGENALIDTYVVVRNDEEVDQGSLNSTLRWSTSSSWKNNGDIYLFGDLQVSDFSEVEIETESYLGASFAASNTYSATQNYTDYEVTGCPGENLYVSLCDERATCNGDTYMWLLSPEGWYLRWNDNYCGLCSSLSYSVSPQIEACVNYTARLGCYSTSSCSGTPLFRVTVANSTKSMKSWKIRETLTYGEKQYRASTYLFQEYSETLSAYGEGQYLIESGYDW
jgi:hypothetical protein